MFKSHKKFHWNKITTLFSKSNQKFVMMAGILLNNTLNIIGTKLQRYFNVKVY
jgi:hypothetical protein